MYTTHADPAVAACLAASAIIASVNAHEPESGDYDLSLVDELDDALRAAYQTRPASLRGIKELAELIAWEIRENGLQDLLRPALDSLLVGIADVIGRADEVRIRSTATGRPYSFGTANWNMEATPCRKPNA